MTRKLLDTSILIRHWLRRAAGGLARSKESHARKWAEELIEVHRTNAIVTPVYLEMVCGVTSGHELKLTRAFLSVFTIIDGGSINDDDWVEARRIAERIVEPPRRKRRRRRGPRNPRKRQLGDCLIRAIARRLKYDVISAEQDFPV